MVSAQEIGEIMGNHEMRETTARRDVKIQVRGQMVVRIGLAKTARLSCRILLGFADVRTASQKAKRTSGCLLLSPEQTGSI